MVNPKSRRKEQIAFSRQLREESTKAERAMWARLRGHQLAGLKFRRQQPLGPYIVDFVCFEKKIVVEIDGGQHNEEAIKQKDKDRTAWLQNQGFQVLRFWNNEVVTNIEGLLEKIRRSVD